MPGRAFSRQFTLEIRQQIAAGEKRPAQVSREHQLTPSLLHRWRQQYTQHGAPTFTPEPRTEIEALEDRAASQRCLC